MTRLARLRSQPQLRSLRGQLALLAVGIAAVSVVLLGSAFFLLLDNQIDATARNELRARVEAAATTVTVGPGGALTLRGSETQAADNTSTWVFQAGTALRRPLAPDGVQELVDGLVGRGVQSRQTDGGDGLLALALPLGQDGRQVGTVVGVLSLQSFDRTKYLVQLSVLGLGLLVLGGTFLATRFTVGRALRPVTAMTGQAAEWSATDVERRFGQAQRPTELDALATTLDGLLDRLSAVLRHEQRLTAELSHELRTPLARIVAEVELLQSRDRSRNELHDAHAAIAASAERMDRILKTLLSAARSASTAPPGRCDVGATVIALWTAYDDPRLRIEPTAGLVAGVDPEVLERIVAPLVDNALRHARHEVVVQARPGPCVVVLDDGPGLPEELREVVFEPGRTGGPAAGHSGAGLGLALSRRLARAAGGDVHLDAAGSGGLAAVVTLPGA